MEVNKSLSMNTMDEFDYAGKTVLLRLDINSPIDGKTKKIVNENRIKKSVPTVEYLLNAGAKVAIIAHQGDTLDYQNLIPLQEHAERLSVLLGRQVAYIDDVCGPAACKAVKDLSCGEAVLLGNLRYLTEEVSTFESAVKLQAEEMLDTWLVRRLAPLVDYYVNDAFSAAHRNAPSMVAFQKIKPSAAGLLFEQEMSALAGVTKAPARPCVFVLGGAKISDAFGMMEQVLEREIADKLLTCGITGEIMLLAKGIRLGEKKEQFINERGLDVFIPKAADYLSRFPGKIEMPLDLAYEEGGARREIGTGEPLRDELYMDIGAATIEKYRLILATAKTIFVNGPAGAYEQPCFEKGTREIWQAIADSAGYSVIGGGDTVSAAQKLIDVSKIGYVCTAGGAMVQFLSGDKLPLVGAMEDSFTCGKE